MARRKINKNDLSTKRRKVQTKRTFLFVFAGLLILGAIGGLFRAKMFRINDIEVAGAKNIPVEEIKALVAEKIEGNYLLVIPKNNVFFYPKEQIAAALSTQFPRIASLDINAGFNGVLSVGAQEKVLNALWCSSSNDCYLMDYSGFIFDRGLMPNDNKTFVFRGLVDGDPIGKYFSDEKTVHALLSFVKKLEGAGFSIYSIMLKDAELAEANDRSGTVLKFIPSEAGDLELVQNISLFMKNMGLEPALFEYIDARYGNKIFYKIR